MWILATRTRINNCQRFIDHWTATQASSPVYVRLDNCDPALEELKLLPWPDQFEIHVGPRQGIRAAANEMFQAYPQEPWYGILADDLIPRTTGWDQLLITRAGSCEIVYANDIHEKLSRICHPCIGGDLVRFVGFLGLPEVRHFGIDTLWEDLHHACDKNNKLVDVILEHAHYSFDQAPMDIVYQESQSIRKDDKYAYRQWKRNHFDVLVARVQEKFGW